MPRVVLTPAALVEEERGRGPGRGRVMFVVDILRATTTICSAIHHGAKAVVPVGSVADARRAAAARQGAVLAGERGADPIPGFDLGNSPGLMTPAAVGGRTVVLTTTNGTRALMAAAEVGVGVGVGAAEVYALAAVNFAVSVLRARAILGEGRGLTVLCAGHEGEVSREDCYTAGRLVAALEGAVWEGKGRAPDEPTRYCLDLAATTGDDWYQALMASRAGQALSAHGYAGDVREAATQDLHPVLPLLRDGHMTSSPTER